MNDTIQSPYLQSPGAIWLRGNLHTHTTHSDGSMTPQEAINAYAGRGYDFLALSDHDVVTDPAGLDHSGVILLPAREVSAPLGHLLLVGPGSDAAFRKQASQQEMIDQVMAAGGIAVLCHPNWGRNFSHYAIEQLRALSGYTGVEVFNGSAVDAPGSALALEKWDLLLDDRRVVRGFANDDMHRPTSVGRGWNMVLANGRTPEAILAALRSGSFYASTGVTLDRIEWHDSILRIDAANAQAFAVIGAAGQQLAWTEAARMTFDAARCSSPYFRIEAYGQADRKAWTQPFMVSSPGLDRIQALLSNKPTLRVPVGRTAPRLTGDLSDPAWQQAAVTDQLIDGDDGGEPAVRTELRCLVAKNTLFFGVTCMEPLPDQMRLTIRENGRSSIWANDSVEFFLDVEGRAENYFHFIVSAAGYLVSSPRGKIQGAQCGAVPEARTMLRPDAYTVELAVPLADLGVTSLPPRMGFNLVRNRYAEPGRFIWSFVGESNHEPRRFGSLLFDARP